MDWSWLTKVLGWIVQINSLISNVASILGFFVLLSAVIGYVIARRDGGFGPKYNKEARYYRFFRPVAEQLPVRDEDLKPRRLDVAGPFANYDSSKGLRYRAHFMPSGKFGVYLNLTGQDVKGVPDGLKQREADIRKLLGLDARPGFVSRLFRRSKPVGELAWEPTSVTGSKGTYRVTLYYPAGPGALSITASGRKLKRVQRWALDNLVALQQVLDKQVPEVRDELKRAKTAVPAPAVAASQIEAAV